MKGSNSKGTSDVVRQNLLDAKAKLVAQEADLVSKLEQIRKGIEGIETTIQVVGAEPDPVAVPKTRKPRTTAKPAEKTPPTASTPRKTRTPRAAKQPASLTKAPAKTAAKTTAPTAKTTKAPAKAPAKAAKAPAKAAKAPAKTKAPAPTAAPEAKKERKSSKEDAGWQTFMMDEFKGKPLTEVVEIVFNRSPQALMGSNELIGQIFSADIPKKERTSARDRLLNILSIGVNEKKWYRAKPGQYTLTKGTTAKGK
jgi:hypothetical protein